MKGQLLPYVPSSFQSAALYAARTSGSEQLHVSFYLLILMNPVGSCRMQSRLQVPSGGDASAGREFLLDAIIIQKSRARNNWLPPRSAFLCTAAMLHFSPASDRMQLFQRTIGHCKTVTRMRSTVFCKCLRYTACLRTLARLLLYNKKSKV